jgi:tetratricopeptide (TPR) repeat protein
MSEAIIKANSTEAQRLLQRGIAAAQGGQRRVAAGLLTRAVQLDPQNERAWLWLSGVLDNHDQVAFCLQTVLKLNPSNERALQGLRWIEQRKQTDVQPRPANNLPQPTDDTVSNREARTHGESWWVNWRHNRQEMSRARVLLWIVPLLMLLGALVLNQLFAQTVAEQLSQATVVPTIVITKAEPTAVPTPQPLLDTEPASVRDSLTAGYLSALGPLRERLRTATATYREATGGSGGASLTYVAATQTLRETVAGALEEFKRMTPPTSLEAAHNDYIVGLTLEIEGLDAVLEFYSSYGVEHANRAALRFQEARTHIDRARAAFDGRSAIPGAGGEIPPQTIR